MHTVLEPSIVIDGLPVNVVCLSTWGERLIVGCAEGAFLGMDDDFTRADDKIASTALTNAYERGHDR